MFVKQKTCHYTI